MRKAILLTSFAALGAIAAVSTAGATPIAPVKVDVALVKPVTYFGYRHHGFFRPHFRPFFYGYYPYSYGFYSGYPHFRRHWY